MINEFTRDLIINVSLLLTLNIIYNTLFINYSNKRKLFDSLMGVLIGLVGILLMINSVEFEPGVVFDTRSILVSITGMFFGFIPTAISAIVIIVYRLVMGGMGTFTGIAVTITSSAIGLIWNRIRLNKLLSSKKNVWIEIYIFGFITHVIMLLCMFTLPYEISIKVIKDISFPVIIIFPVGSLLLGMLILSGYKNMQTKINLQKSEVKYKNLYIEYQNKQILLISLLHSIPDLIFYKNKKGEYLGCNRAFEIFIGKNESKIIGNTDYDIFDKDLADQCHNRDNLVIDKKVQSKNEIHIKSSDGNYVYLETVKTPFYNPQGEILGLIGISRDITDRKQKEKDILYLSYHDVLTGLYNRTFFDHEKVRIDIANQLPLSVIVGDINGLKFINDAFGHYEGDRLLIKVSKILVNCCRSNDIIARTGGDEFSIILPQTDFDSVKIICDNIKAACDEYTNNSTSDIYYTSISLGYYTKVNIDESIDTVLNTAEEYMYRRKLLAHKSLHSSIISSIKTAMYEKSNETEEHAERLAIMSKKLGQAVGLNEDDLVALELVSTLHDIGKIRIDTNILNKQEKLNDNDWAEIKKHPEIGYRIAQTIPELRDISDYILCHHERWDGKGYPQGLSGEEIPLLSRILFIVDSYDAMIQDRAYRKGMSSELAIVEIMKNAGTQFDPVIAKIFADMIKNI